MISLEELYNRLREYFGPQHWWPVDTMYHRLHGTDPRFEVIIGAILTQNTAWRNVEKALLNLKKYAPLTAESIVSMSADTLRDLIHPSGFFNQKSKRLKDFSRYLMDSYRGDLDLFLSRDTLTIREELLSLPGIGPETADSILLYAGNHPVFVVDAYTKRLCSRIPIPAGRTYDEIQCYFHEALTGLNNEEEKVSLYKEYHALIVQQGKNICRMKPICDLCCINNKCSRSLR
jgi:endonuclease-3 related protein